MSTPATLPASPAARATRREWTGLAVIALPCTVYAMDLTVLNLALPAISAQFKPSASELLWMVDIYGFLVAGFLITMGTLGDRIGRRRLLLYGAAAFAGASIVAALATSAAQLIAARALLGVAGATVAPSTLALIRNMFHDEHERQFAIGVWIASYSAGAAIGPLAGGMLLEFFPWTSVFWVAVPVMALLLVLGPALLPEYRDPKAGRIDAASVALSLGAVLACVYALKRAAEDGPSPAIAAIGIAGVALAAVFLRRQRRIDYPLLDTTLFANPAFRAAIAAYALTSMAMMGMYLFITQVLQLVMGLSPLAAGLATLPSALGWVVGSLVTPRLARRFERGPLLIGCMLASAIGFVLLVPASGPFALPILIVATVITSLGMAPVIAVGNEMIITAAPPQRAGAASALSETSAEASAALGIAVVGSAGLWLYRRGLDAALPSGLTEGTAESARATLGGAVAAASAMPGEAGAALAAAAREAFFLAYQASAVASVLLLLLACALTWRILGARRGR
jgi:DHA2 family multidrug resistance protein-like MFS transporter